MQIEGRVVQTMGKQHLVWDGARILRAFPGGRLSLAGGGSRNLVAVGDKVRIRLEGEGPALIEEVLERRNKISRRISFSGVEHVIAANVDVLAIVLTTKPTLNTGLLDRYLVEAHASRIKPVILVNKIDLVAPGETLDSLEPYRKLSYTIYLLSAKVGEGLDNFLGSIRGKWVVLVGHSGVGKTTIVNRAAPERPGAVAGVNLRTGRGRHTTSSAIARWLDKNTVLIDTAGIREFGLWGMDWRCVEEAYPEIHGLASGCKYADCRHVNEPDCAVRAALGRKDLSMVRYESYLRLFNEVKSRN